MSKATKRSGDTYGMYVTGANKDAIAEARAALIAILESSADQATKQAAIKVLGKLCKSAPVSISGCSVTTGSAA